MFFIQENVAFNLSATQSIPTSNEQLMKTKLSYVLLHVKKICETFKETSRKK